MHRIARLVPPLIALALSAAPVAAASPVTVGGAAGWVSTGIEVTAGERLPVLTLGTVQTASIPAFLVPGEFKSASGPAGQVDGALCGDVTATLPPEVLEATGPCMLDEAYFGELIGRVGGVTFAIGSATEIVAPASGTLELAVNDLANTYGDNRGAFTVVFR